MKKSTTVATMANGLLKVLQRYTKGIRLVAVLTMLFTLGVGSVLGAALGDGYEKVTNISTLSAGDRVVLYCDANSVGVTGWDGNKDAKVAASSWVEYLVESAAGGVYLKDENASYYIASPGSSNQFKYGTKAVCTVDANGVLKCNNRFLVANGTYYRMYSSVGSYKAFYVYKIVTSTPIYTIKVSSNNDSWGTANVSGNTITADPADCYQVKSGVDGYTIISGTATVTHDGNSNTLTVTASSDCSIQVNFEKKPVNTYIDNVQGYEEQEHCGDHSTPTLADKTQATTGTCEQLHWHFMGWITEANKENPTDDNIVKAGASVTANGTTYYAVWAKGTTTGGGSTSKQYSFDITKGDFNTTSYVANNNSKTSTAKASDNSTKSVSWTSNQVMQQSSTMQWQSSKGYIYNTTDLGNITNITITSTAGSFTTYYGTSPQPSQKTSVGTGNGYFQIKVGSATGKVSNIKVTFTQTVEGETTTTYSDYITSCTTQTANCSLLKFTTDITGDYTATYRQKAPATELTVAAEYDNGSSGVTYQWYSNATNSITNGTPISGATSASYTPLTTTTGTTYYYCVATYDEECTITSNVATVTIIAPVPTFTVTFDSDGGSAVASQTIEEGNKAIKPEDPTKNGYEFAGWYNGNTEFDFSTSITGDLTLKAKWNIITYNIEYTGLEGATHSNPATYTIETATITFTAPSNRDGYVFKGWTPASIAKGSTGDKTVTAQWTPTYTITWLANGQEFHKQENAEEGTALDLPDSKPNASTYACDDKVFVGWTATPISGTTDDEPADLFTTKTAKVEEAATTYYAVFATPSAGGGSSEELINEEFDNNSTSDSNTAISESTFSNFSGTTAKAYKSKYGGIKFGTSSSVGYITSKTLDLSKAFIVTLDACKYGSDGECSIQVTVGSNTKTIAHNDLGAAGTFKSFTLEFEAATSTSVVKIGTKSSRAYIDNVIISTQGGGTSYSDYVTSCVALPDPVISFVTTPADPIVFDPVNCGSTTTKAQAKTVQVSGANLQEYVSVEVTGPYKIAKTSSTNLSDYTTSLTLEKTQQGAINANYNTIYIISCPPAQSTDATTGELTFTTKKGNTLTVNLSTPTVNCTTYALTFNDRGSKTVENYYAGVEVPQPEDPTGVCTDPIHYVFDGWAEETVTNGSTEYTKVDFPYTMPGQNKTLYAVYRYLTSGGNGDYNLVTSALDDWSGDYLIAYNNETFADGTVGGEDGIGKLRNKVDLSSYISNNTIPATEGDKYKVTLEAVTGGYVLKTQDGKYNYHTNNTENGISTTTVIGTADNYPINVNFVSQEEINLCLTGDAKGSVLRYNTTGYFRFYKNGGQEPVYLYKKSTGTTLYTTSPVCGPHVEITSDKDIYITSGFANGRNTVIAQKKITFAATRLKPSAGGAAPSIKVPAADITLNGGKTDKVKIVDITQNIVLQDDGITYAGTGEITVSYTPTASNIYEDINVQLRAEHNTGSDVSLDAFTVHARSLPQEFVIVAKSGDKWYALNGDMSNGSSANPANGHVVVDDDNEPTKATYAPCNTIYTFDGLPNTGDRKFVRFQGTDGAWLWAASGTNVGIQNKSLATTPAGDNAPYNWEIETENNITYFFHNANSSRVLRLNDGKFGMYVGGTDVIRILPYEAKCLYNYAPSNLKVSELKSTYVTLVWDAVAGATKYQYSTDATNWTDCGTEPTVTINGLEGDTEYIYYIRAYHADAGVNQECFDYSEVSFTTANCDDVPTNITYTADLNSITVSWTASAPTATIKLSMNADGTGGGGTYNGATSPYKISGGLTKNTTYYIQILADGTCASPIIPVKTEDVKVDIVEWQPQGIVVDINTNETVGVTLENEVSYGSGTGSEATELFFSKYYEATTNVKLVAIYNGTKNIIDLTDYEIHYGKTPEKGWETNYITLKDFGEIKGQIQPGEELILYTMSDSDNSDKQIMNCVNAQYPNGKWVRVTQANNTGKGSLSFAGDKTIVLKKAGTIIDIIGAINSNGLPNNAAVTRPSWGDANGWTCATGLSIADDTEIGISTNRCLLIRNNSVTSGDSAVAKNIDNFVTLCSEWKGAQVPDSDLDNGVAASCENFAYVGTFDYSDYYTKFESMGEGTTFEENDRNPDGTVNVPITDLYKQSCRNIRIKLSNEEGDVLTDREYKVPIMITTTQGTDGEAFIALQDNLAMMEITGDGDTIYHALELNDVREICKTCDVVIRDNATLQKMADDAENDHPQVRDIYVYENSSLIVPAGTNYTINSLSLRRKGDEVASLNVYPDALKLPESSAAPITLDLRIDAQNWHWFALPYNCNIKEVTWADGTPTQFNTDWFLMTYDGESRSKEQSAYENHWKQYFGTTIEEGKGYIVGITGDINNPARTYELRFPIAKEVLADEKKEKTVDVRAWGVEDDIRPNKKGWNLIGNPYLTHYQKNNVNSFGGLRLGELKGPDPQTGYWTQTGNLPYVVVPVDGGWTSYDQLLVSETDLLPFTAYFVQVGNDGVHTSEQDLKIAFDSTKLLLSTIPMPASLIRRAPSEIDEVKEPVIVGISLTNSLGENDKTSLIIDNRYTDEYEMNADFFKWFGDYYKYYTKPVLYTIGADDGKRAFNAISEELATQPISLGMYAAQAGDYTFTLDRRSDLSRVQEVWLYDAAQETHINLLQDSYTFQTAKTESAGRFFLSVKLAPEVSTEMDNVTDGTVWATTQDHTIVVNGLLSDAQLWIYDATGKLLHTDHTLYYQHSYSVPQSGTYFVRVQNTMQTQTIKVVVE